MSQPARSISIFASTAPIHDVTPAISEASDTITPLNPSRRRSRSPFSSRDTDAGRNASTPASGSAARTNAGSAMWADITLITPASMAAR